MVATSALEGDIDELGDDIVFGSVEAAACRFEQLSPLAWVTFAVTMIGVYLVEPKDGGEEIVIDRKFSDRGGTQ